MRFQRTFGLLVLPASLFIFAGCGSANAPDTGTSTAQQVGTPAKTPATQKLRARMPRGPAVMVLRSALSDLSLDAAQKTKIQGIIAQLKPVQRTTHAAMSKALAKAVRSGKVDPASFTDQYAAIETRVKDRIAKQESALDQLHATLDKADRGLLVDQLESKLAKRAELPRHGMRHWRGHWMHRAPTGKAQVRAELPAQHAFRRGPHMMGGFMAHKLGLSQAQIAKLRDQAPATGMAKKGECEKHMGARRAEAKKMLDAFVSDDFKAEKLLNADAIAQRVAAHAKHRVERLARLVDVLTPAQRTQFANMLERRTGGRP